MVRVSKYISIWDSAPLKIFCFPVHYIPLTKMGPPSLKYHSKIIDFLSHFWDWVTFWVLQYTQSLHSLIHRPQLPLGREGTIRTRPVVLKNYSDD